MEQEFKDRINLNTDLNIISKQICKNYDLGEYISDTIITVGKEEVIRSKIKVFTGKEMQS